MIAALLLAAAPPTAAPATALDCRLVTPGGHPIAFTARLKAPGVGAAVLDPTPGTAWPSQRVIGGGGHQVKAGGIKSTHHFAGNPGLDLEIDGERATLLATKKLRRGLPRAHGFCLPMANAAATADGSGMVSTQAGAAIPAFDPATWQDHCELVTRSGRRWKFNYSVEGGGKQSGFTATSPALFGATSVVVSRRGGSGKASFGEEKNGPFGTERLSLDTVAQQGVQLLDFKRTALPGAEQAAGICGFQIVKRRTTP